MVWFPPLAQSYKFRRLEVYRNKFGRVAACWCQKDRKKFNVWRNVSTDVTPTRKAESETIQSKY
jgi:hypothetical protein